MRLTHLLSAVVLFASVLCGQTAEEREDAVQEFKRFFRKFKTVGEKVEAVRTLEGNECVSAAKELIGLLSDKEPDIAKTAMEVLGTYKDDKTFDTFVATLPKMKNQDQRAALVRVLGNSGIRSAMPVIVDIVLNDKKATTELRFSAARAATAMGEREHSPKMLEVLLTDSDPLVRMAAVEAVGGIKIKSLGKPLVPLLNDSAWQVQTAAVDAIALVREPEAVTPLIDLMEKGGRLEEECADALFKITGFDFGTDVGGWRTAWERVSAIDGWRIPTDQELAKKAAARKKYDAIYGKREKEATTFGGIPTTSTRVLFIVDVSGSMADLVVEKERFDAEYDNFQKLTIVKTELTRTIESLDKNTLFNIVSFASDTKTWKKRLMAANVVNRKSATTWVRKLKPIGGPEAQAASSSDLAAGKTNTFKALMYPFGVDPDKKGRPTTGEDGAMKNLTDTVFFLSDGRPSTGKYTDTTEILKEVGRLNDRYKMVFHAIAIGEFQKNFLKTLAEHNGGVFVDLGR